jgi:hypothetical protein
MEPIASELLNESRMLLSCKTADGDKIEFALQSLTRIGRGDDNDIQLFDESASTHHCELQFSEGRTRVRDLGSANGITVNGEPVQEAVLHSGDRLKVGETEFLLEGTAKLSAREVEAGIPVPPRSLSAEGVCQIHPDLIADWRCSKCGGLFCSQCVVDGRKFGTPRVKFCPTCSAGVEDLKAQRTIRQHDAEAARPLDPWRYPLRGEGLILLVAGTLFMALTSVLQRFALLLSGAVFVFTTGYLLAYSQKIITSTAHGDHEPPTWPDFSDFTEDILPPFLHALAVFVLYFLPPFLAYWFLPQDSVISTVVPLVMLGLGLLLAPMAWLAVSMHEQIGPVSPHFVIPSVLRIGERYLLVVIQLAILVSVDAAAGWGLKQVPIPFLPWLLSSFLSLYFLMVFSRFLGMLYYRNRSDLGWF